MNTTTLTLSLAILLAACGGEKDATDHAKDVTDQTVTALVFKSPCAETTCPSAPARGTTDTYECAASQSGSCGWNPGSEATGSSGSKDGDGVVSFSGCEAKECGPVPDIKCGVGFDLSVVCGRENGGTCTNYTVCSPKATDVACAPDACGPRPEIAEICDDGTSSELVCRYLASATPSGKKCAWASGCDTKTGK